MTRFTFLVWGLAAAAAGCHRSQPASSASAPAAPPSSAAVTPNPAPSAADPALAASAAAASGAGNATTADAQRLFDQSRLKETFVKIIDQQRAVVGLSIAAQIRRIQGNATDEEAKQLKEQVVAQLWSGINNQALTDSLAQIYSQHFTTEQLNDLGDFYATPSGQAVLAQAPTIQAEFSAVLMGQLASSNPKAAAMIAAFAKAHQSSDAAR
jgi:hypothetical protein